jgi:outer membrane receptor protein involved in Fe transport
LAGKTSNPKVAVAVNWLLDQDAGLSLRGSWGTSFRFANAGEYSPIASTAFGNFNLPANLVTTTGGLTIACTGGVPTALSAAAKLFAGGEPCGAQLGGLSLGGAPTTILRPANRAGIENTGTLLNPEKATNWSGGVEFAPTTFLPGLDLQATYRSMER